MAYLNLDLDFFDHPKTRRLVGLLGKGAEVLPIKLWCYCGKYHSESGKLTGYSTQEIESIAGWWGEKGEMIDAMMKINFIHQNGNGEYYIHDWKEHEGHIAALKARSRRAAKARWRQCTSNASSNAKSKITNAPALSLGLKPLPSKPTKRFIQPTLEEVAMYCKERENGINAQAWIDHYIANGWKIGKNQTPMKNWRAAVRTWEQREKESGGPYRR